MRLVIGLFTLLIAVYAAVCAESQPKCPTPIPVGHHLGASCDDPPVPCDPGTFQKLLDQTTCDPCPVGTATNATGSVFCPSCTGNTYTDVEGSTECQTCSLGTYATRNNADGNSQCTDCEVGYYCDADGRHECPSGNVCDSTGMQQPGYCPEGSIPTRSVMASECFQCPSPLVPSADNSTCQLCSEADATQCLNCAANTVPNDNLTACRPADGYYNQSGTVTVCPRGYACVNGTISPCVGATYTNVTGSTECSECPAGSYLVPGSAVAGVATGNSDCRLCSNGTYQPLVGQLTCEECPAGTYSNTLDGDMTSCSLCTGANYSSRTSSATCEVCSAGSFTETGDLTSVSGNTACTACTAGSYCPDGSEAILCGPGQYSAASATECTACPDGEVSNAEAGATACTACTKGVPNADKSFCVPCDFASGEFINGSECSQCGANLTPSGDGTTCVGNAGFYGETTDGVATVCPAGFMCPGNGEIYACTGATYTNTTGQTACAVCAVGSIVTPDTVNGTSVNTNCTECAPGTYSLSTTDTTCTECPAGQAQPQGGQTFCNKCTGAEYSTSTASAECSVCPAGSYTESSADGNTACTPCEAGFFCDGQNRTQCPMGQYSTEGSAECTQCPAGQVVNDDSSACVSCAAGSAPSENGLVCVQCQPNQYSENGTQCDTCPENTHDVNRTTCVANPGYYDPTTSVGPSSLARTRRAVSRAANAVLPCPIGFRCPGDGIRYPCTGSEFASTIASTECSPCPVGYYVTQIQSSGVTVNVQCSPCNLGSYADTAGTTNCTLCPAGTFSGSLAATQCEPCPAGTVALTEGTGLCRECPTGYEPSDTSDSCLSSDPCGEDATNNGTISEPQCICPRNDTYYDTASKQCFTCPAGFECNGTENRTACPQGTVSPPGYSSCTQCPEGTTPDELTQRCINSTIDCGPDATPTNVSGALLCICNDDTRLFTNTSGTPTCAECPGGYSCNGTSVQSSCALLGPNYVSAPGAGRCTECANGTIPNDDFTECVDAAQRCGSDATAQDGVCVCNNRAFVFVSSAEGGACEPCPAGVSCNGTSITLACVGNSVSPYNSSQCVSCRRGYTANADKTECMPPPAPPVGVNCGCCAYYAPATDDLPAACICNDPTLVFDPRTRQCTACPCGNFCDGSSTPVACPKGFYSGFGSGVCGVCPTGQVPTCDRCGCQLEPVCPESTVYDSDVCGCRCLDASLTYDEESRTCVPCPCGSSCDGSSQATPCPSGYYSSGNGVCAQCAGNNVVSPDRCSCVPPAPLDCGSEATAINGQCVCNVRTRLFDEGTRSCLPCPCGSSCDGGAVAFKCCNNQYSMSGDGLCTDCPANYTVSYDHCGCNPPIIIGCPVGTYWNETLEQCVCRDSSSYFDNSTQTCRPCLCGHSCNGTSVTEPCPTGLYSAPGTGVCAQCFAGAVPTYDRCGCIPEQDCQNANADWQPAVGSCVCRAHGTYYNETMMQCLPCPCGFSCNGDPRPLPCPVGYISMNGSSICQECNIGFSPEPDQCSCTPVNCGPDAVFIPGRGCVCNNELLYFNSETNSCIACPCGRQCDGSSATYACPSGYVSLVGEARCTACPSGTVPDQNACSCVVPTPNCGTQASWNAQLGQCICFNREYYFLPGSLTCTACPCGYECDGSSFRQACVNNTYSTGGSACMECPAGTSPTSNHCSCQNSCGQGSVYNSTLGQCVCTDKSMIYVPATGSVPAHCAACPCGSSCDGTSVSTSCPTGSYSPAGQGECIACPAGTEPASDRCSCIPVTPDCGTALAYYNSTLQRCVCTDRQTVYVPASASSPATCALCPCASICDGTNTTVTCPSGYYSPAGQSACMTCPTGQEPSPDRCSCQQVVPTCPAGSSYDVSTQQCLCNDRSLMFTQSGCVACPCGTSCDGSSHVTQCPDGYVSPLGSSQCTQCPSGQTPSADRCQCVTEQCAEGSYFDSSVNACRCYDPQMLYSPTNGCVACPCGVVCDGTANFASCPSGYVSPEGVSLCVLCGEGQTPSADRCTCVGDVPPGQCGSAQADFDPTLNQCVCRNRHMLWYPTRSVCGACPCGSICDGTSVPVRCAGGSYSPAGFSSCTACQDGTVPTYLGCQCQSDVTECGTEAVLDGQMCRCLDTTRLYNTATQRCELCPCGYSCDGTTVRSLCPAGQYSPAGSSVCTVCPDGKFPSQDRCQCVDIVEMKSNVAQRLQLNADVCGDDASFNAQRGCICNDQTRYFDTMNGVCALCPAGNSCDGSAVPVNCGASQISPLGSGVCSQCPTGSVPSADQSQCVGAVQSCPTGATLVGSQCICSDGTRFFDGAQCVQCPAGMSCNGSATATRCPDGSVSAPGASVCTPCPSGHVPDTAGATCVADTGIATNSILALITSILSMILWI